MATFRAPTRVSLELLLCAGRRPQPSRAPRPCRSLQPLHTSCPRRANRRPPSAKPDTQKPKTARVAAPLIAAGAGLLGLFTFSQWRTADGRLGLEDNYAAAAAPPSAATDDRDPSLPRFRIGDIRKHDATSGEPWVTHEDKVYNITDWVAAHPGGDVILRAAGASIDPYWDIFTIHKSPHVHDILANYLIGYIDAADLVDGRPAVEEIDDPFEADPARDPRLVTHTAKPCNAEPPNADLDAQFRTPNELFYVRSHMWVPVVDEAKADAHVLTVELPHGEARQYTLAELRARFETHRVTAVLQCSGNRRDDMTRHAGKTNGLQWGVGAISNAEWEGVRLADVLADAGLRVVHPAALTKQQQEERQQQQSGGQTAAAAADDDDDPNVVTDPHSYHVHFSGLEAYGASIPLPTAVDPRGDVLLAFAMNGAPLPRDHGFPLRSVIPGHVAARSVKWLSKIAVADEESPSQWQRRDYKAFGPNEGPNPDWDRAKSIQEMPVTSAITRVWVGDGVRRRGEVPWLDGGARAGAGDSRSGKKKGAVDMAAVEQNVGFASKEQEARGPAASEDQQQQQQQKQQQQQQPQQGTPSVPVALQGYACSGGGREISRVDVSLDGGKTWDQADLVDDWAQSGAKGSRQWAWKRWRYAGELPELPLASGRAGQEKQQRCCTELVVKATDDSYNTQPGDHKAIYNVRGNLATAWHRVKVCATCVPGGRDGQRRGVSWDTAKTYGCGFEKDADEVREHMLASDAK